MSVGPLILIKPPTRPRQFGYGADWKEKRDVALQKALVGSGYRPCDAVGRGCAEYGRSAIAVAITIAVIG
jgi:hypothetical protein